MKLRDEGEAAMRELAELSRLCADLARSDLSPEILERMISEFAGHGLSSDLARKLFSLILEEGERIRGRGASESGLKLREFASRALELQRMGREIFRLELGEPDFTAPSSAVEAACKAIREGYSKYGPANGIKELRASIASKLSEKFKLDLKPDNVAITAGGTFGVYGSIEAATELGDEVIVIEPAWPLYAHQVRWLGRRPRIIRTRFEDDWDPVSMIQDEISRMTRLIILNYPNNPTGKVLDEKSMRAIIELAEDHGAWILSDEVYMDFCYRDGFKSILELGAERAIMVNSFSKTWGMTGFRVGYVISDAETVARVARAQNTAITCIPEFVQRAALAALNDEEAARRNIELIGARLKILYEELSRSRLIEVKPPEGAMYIFPRINVENFDSWRFAWKLLEEKGVAIAPGACFGQSYNNHIRISAVLDEKPLREACRRIREAVEEYS
ncbi:MAG: pyridoxal phosphate-dependent aminotransferase [Nitrososphaerota archaeon]